MWFDNWGTTKVRRRWQVAVALAASASILVATASTPAVADTATQTATSTVQAPARGATADPADAARRKASAAKAARALPQDKASPVPLSNLKSCAETSGKFKSGAARCGSDSHLAMRQVRQKDGSTSCVNTSEAVAAAKLRPCVIKGPASKATAAAAPREVANSAAAALTDTGWSVDLTYTGTSSLTFTAAVNQPLNGTWLEVFELTTGGSTQYLGWCNSGTSCTFGPTAPHATQGQFVAVVGSTITNTYAQYPQASKLAESALVLPPAWTISLTASVTSTVALTATTNYQPGTAGAYIEMFQAGLGGSTNYLGWTQESTMNAVTVPKGHQGTFVAVVGWTLANRFEDYPDSAKAVQSVKITPPPWTVELVVPGAPVAVTNYDVANSGAYVEIFDLGSTWVVTYVGWCSTGTVCALNPGIGPYLATVGSLSNHPIPDPTWAISNIAGPGTTSPGESFGGSNPSTLGQCGSCQGDPVNTATGEFFTSSTDMSVPGRGPALVVNRSYSSSRASFAGPFGLGWTGQLGMRVTESTGNVTVRQENGSTVTFTGQADGTYTAPSRVLATLQKNADGSFRLVRRARQVFDFASSGELRSVFDLNGEALTFSYDANGPARIASSSGRAVTFTAQAGRVTSATDPTGRVVNYGYDAVGHLTKVTDPTGAVTQYAYDGMDRLTTVTDPLARVRTNTYDTVGRVSAQLDPAGGSTTFAYASNGETTVTSPAGRAIKDTYVNGVLTAQTTAVGTPAAATSTYTYDANLGALATVTDPRGDTSVIQTDSAGNTTRATDALGRSAAMTYDSLNSLRTLTDPRGVTATMYYDAKGNLLSATQAVGSANATVTYTRDTAHPADVVRVTDATGRATTMTYTSAGDLASVKDGVGNTSTFGVDAAGRRTSSTSPRGGVARVTFDQAGRPATATDALGRTTTWTYDGAGQVTAIKDALGRVSAIKYDSRGLPKTSTAADGSVMTLTYDADGLVKTRTDPAGNTTSYALDEAGRVASVTDPLSRGTSLGYDLAGNAVTVTDPSGRVTTTTYDALNRATDTRYDDGVTPPVSIRYDESGRVTSQTDGSGATTFAYDDLDNLLSATEQGGVVTGYQRDLAGRLVGLTYPNGKSVTRGYDAAGRLASVTDWLGNTSSFTYDADGNQVTAKYGAITTDTRTFDLTDAQTSTSVVGANRKAVNAATYTRNALGQVATAVSGGTTHTYSYSAIDQLAKDATTKNSATSFTFDVARNRTAATMPTGTATALLTYDAAGQPTAFKAPGATSIPMTYDALGNRKSGPGQNGTGTAAYTYDQANHLKSVTSGGATTAYTSSASGLTTTRTDAGATKRFTWSRGGGLPLLLTDGDRSYLYDDAGLPLAHITTAGVVAFYQHDQYGSTTSLTSTTGATLGTYGYNVDGRTTAHTGTDTPLQWGGQYHDPTTGLYNLRARHYDPATAQFISRDPLESITGTPYSYAASDPVNQSDPTGLCPMCIGALIGAGTELGFQVLGNLARGCDAFDSIDWGQVAVSGALGAVGGGLGSFAKSFRAADEIASLTSGAAGAGVRALPTALSGGAADTYVYFGAKNGKNVYVGITNNLGRRQAEHGARFALDPITSAPVTRGQARSIEQAMIVRNPGFQNVRNSISPKHGYYDDAVAWGESWLKQNGF